MTIRHRIDVASGRRPADLLLTNCRVVSVFADKIINTDVAIADGVIAGFGDYEAKRTINLKGGFLSSGLIDSHIHIESTLLSPSEFARIVVPHGTTSVVADPHEIANVMGASGIKWMINASKSLPLDVYIVLPSCVPESKFVTSSAKLGAAQLKTLARLPRVIGIGEVMNFPDVIKGDAELLKKIRLIPGMRVDGHAPGLTGKQLAAYVAAGIHSDHESTKRSEASEKLLAGLHIMIREGTTEKNLKELAQLVTPANSHRCFFCSDDRSATDLIRFGHIDDILRKALKCGISPITALQMATNNAPYYFRLKRRKGAVAVGYAADLVVFENLKNFKARIVFKNGHMVAKDGKLITALPPPSKANTGNTMNVASLDVSSFTIKSRGTNARTIRIVPGQIITKEEIVSPKILKGAVISDTKRDILKLAVVERHHASGRIGLGFVRGFGIENGALASTVCHDSHNLIVVGTNDNDMLVACKALIECGGGFVVASRGKVLKRLPLPIGGLMSDKKAPEVSAEYGKIEKTAKALGSKVKDPFLQLSFLALSVIPSLKLTDKGLVDTLNHRFVSLFV